MQTQPQQVKADIDSYPGGTIADRCKAIYAAYGAHVINLKDMTYALMQYYIAELGNGNMNNNHPLPPKPVKPEAGASVDRWEQYNKDASSWHTADGMNYETTEMMERVEIFQLALRDDDYDYSKAKEWGAYIVTGVDGAVKAYLGDPIPAPDSQQTEAVDESEVPF